MADKPAPKPGHFLPGGEQSKDKVRDHGSAKSVVLWTNQGFASTDPGTCNTFVAPPAKVS